MLSKDTRRTQMAAHHRTAGYPPLTRCRRISTSASIERGCSCMQKTRTRANCLPPTSSPLSISAIALAATASHHATSQMPYSVRTSPSRTTSSPTLRSGKSPEPCTTWRAPSLRLRKMSWTKVFGGLRCNRTRRKSGRASSTGMEA